MNTPQELDYTQFLPSLLPLFAAIAVSENLTPLKLSRLRRKFPKPSGEPFAKDELIAAYRQLAGTNGVPPYDAAFFAKLRLKPTRTISGVTPVTVLTKPFPCPGKCIFCPNDIRMPKSYLADEPGAQRAERNQFDPYLQTYNRLLAYQKMGHSTDKVELIILGGTWSYYPEPYQVWFITECFRALNEFGAGQDGRDVQVERYTAMRRKLAAVQQVRHGAAAFTPGPDPQENAQGLAVYQPHGSDLHHSYNQLVADLYTAPEKLSGADQWQTATWEELAAQQVQNETAACRSVGLVIETRPDNISVAEVRRIRRLGCTKTQIGVQSLQDDVLTRNKRGHDVAATRHAFRLLRQAGFKIHAHWMPNLAGSSPEKDKADYRKLFADPDFQPDELKIYPCSLIESAELMQYYQRGEWQPYTEAELLDLLGFCLENTPAYCRLTRIIRDIPSPDIVVGNKKTNMREMAERHVQHAGGRSQDIRAREVRQRKLDPATLQLDQVIYTTSVSREVFLQFISPEGLLAGFLRLSMPSVPAIWPELERAAIIREVHVYGEAVGIGQATTGRTQHQGLGTRLLEEAKRLAQQAGYDSLAVISAVGTRPYYRQRGFIDGELYQHARLSATSVAVS